ncbi:MAG TPA: response regulator transcription factor [Bryobacteraceae bacterium]|jgi:DNA-binding response OmpR family regulator|nr:response regulator transcription factor [Bryobacteraceae bacterium]
MKFLVFDDDVENCGMLQELLGESGYLLEFESDGEGCLRRTRTGSYDLLIFDVMLPAADGFEVLKRVRDLSQIPVLILSAKAERSDRVNGLRAGADDYLAKPFDPDELLARIQSILRRTKINGNAAAEPIEIGELRLMPASREVCFQGKPLDLTAMEVEILECLMRSFGKVVSRDRLSLRLYNRLAAPFERNVDTHVSRIRRKLGDGRGMIVSVRGTGYQIRTL